MKRCSHYMMTFFLSFFWIPFSNNIAQGQTIAIGKITKLITSEDQ